MLLESVRFFLFWGLIGAGKIVDNFPNLDKILSWSMTVESSPDLNTILYISSSVDSSPDLQKIAKLARERARELPEFYYRFTFLG